MVQFAHPRATTLDLILTGTPAEDFLSGGSGNDIIRGLAGPDHMHGYGGDDFLFGDDGPDEIKGGTGNDHLEGGAGRDRLWGGKGADYVHGGDGDDKIVGHFDGDLIIGGKGADAIRFAFSTESGEAGATARMDGLDRLFLQDCDYTIASVDTRGTDLRGFSLAIANDGDGRTSELDVFLNGVAFHGADTIHDMIWVI